VKLLVTMPAIRGLLEPELNPRLLVMAVAIAVVVGVFSGVYPAWRSSRFTPSHALHG
jgi:putative ABC transport system permease protein